MLIECGENYEGEGGRCNTSIVTSPTYAKALLDTLATSLEEFSERFGMADRS